MFEFFINRTRGGYQLEHNGEVVGVFSTETAAVDIAVRFAQDNKASGWRIYY